MKVPHEEALRTGAREILGRPLTVDEVGKLVKYLELLVKWHKVQRLIGSSVPSSIIDDLLLDSLLFVRVLSPGVERLMDLGSGAGLPGIPLSIVLPSVQVTLVEAKQKRASFLSTAVRELSLRSTRVINSRAEDLPLEYERSFDAVVMRCAGPLDDMMPLAARFVAPGGSVVASGPPRALPLNEGAWTNIARPGRDGARLFAVLGR
jgi:16S rRNA (guanine527-N7)-methyltransferase